MPDYTIDTCSLTQMRRVYPQDVFPTVWEMMGTWADSGLVASIELVYDELEVQDDDVVFQWAEQRKQMFAKLDARIQSKGKSVLAEFPTLVDLKKRKSGADPFVIGHAIVHSTAVVTEEKPVGPGGKRVKIPNVCRNRGIRCITLLDLLRELEASL